MHSKELYARFLSSTLPRGYRVTALCQRMLWLWIVQHTLPLTVCSMTPFATTAKKGHIAKVSPDLTPQADKWPLGTPEVVAKPLSRSRLQNVMTTRVSLTYPYGQWGRGEISQPLMAFFEISVHNVPMKGIPKRPPC